MTDQDSTHISIIIHPPSMEFCPGRNGNTHPNTTSSADQQIVSSWQHLKGLEETELESGFRMLTFEPWLY